MMDLNSPSKKNGSAENNKAEKAAANSKVAKKPTKDQEPELTSEEKEAAEMNRVKKANASRLTHFSSSRSMDEKKRFKVVSKHPSISKDDACAVVGALEHKELSNGYKNRKDALKAADELNKQYFNS